MSVTVAIVDNAEQSIVSRPIACWWSRA